MTRINLYKTITLSLLFSLCFGATHAQDKTASIKAAVEARQFVFDAQTVIPTTGRSRQLGGEGYQIKVNGDSLVSHLPYFGRAYTATLGNEDGLRFTSTAFDYSIRNKKKGGWEISLRPKDVTDLREFLLTVSEKGYARLQALSNNRQPISFNGTVNGVQ